MKRGNIACHHKTTPLHHTSERFSDIVTDTLPYNTAFGRRDCRRHADKAAFVYFILSRLHIDNDHLPDVRFRFDIRAKSLFIQGFATLPNSCQLNCFASICLSFVRNFDLILPQAPRNCRSYHLLTPCCSASGTNTISLLRFR